MNLNLIYFIYFDGKLNHYHKLNLQYLRKYWDIFNGKKIVKIAINGGYSLRPILELLPNGCFVETVKNDKNLGEAKHFVESFQRINSGQTFYAHCKGVSRVGNFDGLDIWIKHLYEDNLGQIPDLIDKLFSGTCGKLLPCPPYVPESFHYSGSFYWINSNKVRIGMVKLDRYFTERFPGMVAREDQCIFLQPSSRENLCYYYKKTWENL